MDEDKTLEYHTISPQLMWKKNKSLDVEKGSSFWESVVGLRQAQFAIQGMTCSACTSAVKSAVEPLDGIISVDVHFISNQAIVIYQPTVVDHSRISDAIEDSGYGATLWEDVKLEAETHQHSDTRTIEIEIHGYNRLVIPALISIIQYTDTNSCSSPSVNDRLGRLGLLSFTPITMSNRISTITYRPSKELTIRHILDFPAPIVALIRKRPSIHVLARKSQRQEAKSLSSLLLLSFLIAIPTFVIGVLGMTLLPKSNSLRMWCEEFVWGGCQRTVFALFILSTLSQFAVNRYFVVKAWKSMRTSLKSWHWSRLLSFGSMDLLVALSTTIAYLASLGLFIRDILRSPEETMKHGSSTFFDSNIFLGFFILAGRVLEHYARTKTTDAISKLEASSPDHALLLLSRESGTTDLLSCPTKKISADLIDIGDLLLLPAGSSPPADGVVVVGSSAFDESSLTGESLPVSKGACDPVMTGTKNLGSPIVYRVNAVGQETMMRKIIRAVADGQTKRSPIQLLAEKITSVFVPIIVYISLVVLAVWLAVCLSVPASSWVLSAGQTATGDRLFIAFQFSIAVLVIACPCGIGLAAPTAQAVGSGLLAKNGILAQGGGEAFQLASTVDIIVFDKTGTLTKGEASVVNAHLAQGDGVWLWDAIKMSEAISTHPLAQAIVFYCEAKSQDMLAKMVDCEEIAGKGVRSTFSLDDRTIRLSIGSQKFISQEHPNFELPTHLQDLVNSWRDMGNTVVFVLQHDSGVSSIPVLFGIADQIRPGFKEVIENFKASGKEVYMLTGDNHRTALAVGREVSLDKTNIKAGVLPLEKARIILKFKQRRRINSRTWLGCYRSGTSRPAILAFVGDGLNDSAALAAADIGIALSHGSDVSIASASFVVLSTGSVPHAIKQLFKISAKVYRRQVLNFGWAMLYNVALIPVAAGVLYPYRHTQLSPVWSALAMALSSLSVVVSSLALKWGI